MYKVFINNNLLYLLTKAELNKITHNNYEVIEFKNEKNIEAAINRLENSEGSNSIFLVGDIHKILKKIKQYFIYIKAGGGLVRNNKGEILLIYRNKHWDLPKGKLGKKETKAQGALREVTEECGLNSVEIKSKLPSTYHMYKLNEKWVFKKTFWYEMYSEQNQLKPQTEEGVEKVLWLNKDKILSKMNEKMYASIKALLLYYFNKY